MTIDLFIALLIFAGIAAFTPGPNNAIAMASGISFGFKRTLPMILGVAVGFPAMIACIGLGLGQVFETYPQTYVVMRYAGAAYMLWLAWKIATAELQAEGELAAGAPFTFMQAALFQWINPKAWVIAATALSAYTVASDYRAGMIAIIAIFTTMSFSSCATWALFGVGLRHVLNDPRYFRRVNIALALLLVASLVPMLWH
jgi:threonine/homoserine/homoserine lactone efflux protein